MPGSIPKHFAYINSFNLHSSLMRWVTIFFFLSSLLYRYDREIKYLLKIVPLVRDRARSEFRQSGSRSHDFNPYNLLLPHKVIQKRDGYMEEVALGLVMRGYFDKY